MIFNLIIALKKKIQHILWVNSSHVLFAQGINNLLLLADD